MAGVLCWVHAVAEEAPLSGRSFGAAPEHDLRLLEALGEAQPAVPREATTPTR